jgi:hypothetical protein
MAKPGTTERDKAIPNVKGQVSARRHQTLCLPSRMAALSETTNRQPQRNSAQGYVDRFGCFAGLTAIVKFEENRARRNVTPVSLVPFTVRASRV